MTGWKWELAQSEQEGLFWDSGLYDLESQLPLWIFVGGQTSKYIGQRLIKTVQQIDPISCQLYKLVYGRCP
jgi:hypothetical protein